MRNVAGVSGGGNSSSSSDGGGGSGSSSSSSIGYRVVARAQGLECVAKAYGPKVVPMWG